MKTIPIGYHGKKELKDDPVAGTGLTWTQGEVHDVPIEKASLLLAHPDVWYDARDKKSRKKDPVDPTEPQKLGPLDPDQDLSAAKPAPLELVDTTEKAVTFAKSNFNVDLDPELTLEEMHTEIRTHMDRTKFGD
jgi:hypothetical protein